MSRAFTREIDDAPAPPPAARPISAAPNFVTARGAQLIEAEVNRLAAALPEAAAGETAAIQRELRYWSARQQSMQIITPAEAPVAAGFGAIVELQRGGRRMRLKIVGEDEANPAEGLLAWTSPLAQALDGAEAGELIEFEAGGRVEMIEVVSVAGG